MLTSPAKDAAQVQLQVRVAEVSRNRLRDIGTTFGYESRPGVGGLVKSGGGPAHDGQGRRGGDIFRLGRRAARSTSS